MSLIIERSIKDLIDECRDKRVEIPQKPWFDRGVVPGADREKSTKILNDLLDARGKFPLHDLQPDDFRGLYGYLLGLEALTRNNQMNLDGLAWEIAEKTKEVSLYQIMEKIGVNLESELFSILFAQDVPHLELDDRSDYWSKFFMEQIQLKMNLRLPPSVEFGFSASKSAKNTTVPTASLETLLDLRRRIPSVNTASGVENLLRDWSSAESQVVARALTILIARLDLSSDLVVGHAIPAALCLMDAYDDETRADFGMTSLLRIFQKVQPSQLTKYFQILCLALQRARTLASERPQNAALFGRVVLRFIALTPEPKDRQKLAYQAVSDAISDLKTWRHEQSRTEIVRWRLSPAIFLFLHDNNFILASFLTPLIPLFVKILKERAPSMPVILTLRSLHALAVLAWPRFSDFRLLSQVLPAVLLAAAKADDCLRHAPNPTSKKKIVPNDQEHALNMIPLAPVVLQHALHLIALLYDISAPLPPPSPLSSITKRIEAECSSDVLNILHKALAISSFSQG